MKHGGRNTAKRSGRMAGEAPAPPVRPVGRKHLEVKVLHGPDKGEPLAEGKGADREVGSEESRRQNAGLTYRKHI
jgi:hypothetical protein